MAKKAKCLKARFWSSVSANSAEGCWNWNGPKTFYGYGRLMESIGNGKTKQLMAHRFAYEQIVGKIQDVMTIDHVCRNKLCVNPAHMEVVTRGENSIRSHSRNMVAMRENCCTNGHKIENENVIKEIRGNGKERLRCKICSLEREKKRKKK